jgi:Ca2+-binding EF-hand superfamily protein
LDCPDGKLSKEKFIELYQGFYKNGRVNRFCERAFGVFDRDGSGGIGEQRTRVDPDVCRSDFVEFLMAVNLASSQKTETKVDLFFAMCDVDGNNRIDLNELHAFLHVRRARSFVNGEDVAVLD